MALSETLYSLRKTVAIPATPTAADILSVVGPAYILGFGCNVVTATSGTDMVLKMDSVKNAARGDGDIGSLTVGDYSAGTTVYKNVRSAGASNGGDGFLIAKGETAVLKCSTGLGSGTVVSFIDYRDLSMNTALGTGATYVEP